MNCCLTVGRLLGLKHCDILNTKGNIIILEKYLRP